MNCQFIKIVVPNIADLGGTFLVVIGDYLSLFIIRKLLTLARIRPFLTLLLAVLAGGCVVTSVIAALLGIVAFYRFGVGDHQHILEQIRRSYSGIPSKLHVNVIRSGIFC